MHEILPARNPARIEDIWMTPKELDVMVDAKTGFIVNALLKGRVLGNDGMI